MVSYLTVVVIAVVVWYAAIAYERGQFEKSIVPGGPPTASGVLPTGTAAGLYVSLPNGPGVAANLVVN